MPIPRQFDKKFTLIMSPFSSSPPWPQTVAPSPQWKDFALFFHQLTQPNALVELAVLVFCLGLAWGGVYLIRGRVKVGESEESVLFGRRILDGVLFPIFALLLAIMARRELNDHFPVAVFNVVLPILTSLCVIRLVVKVLGRAFPDSNVMRVVERTVSWLAWVAVVLWITGFLPLLLDELARIHIKLGTGTVSLRDVLEGALSAVIMLILALWVSSVIEAQLLKGAQGARLSVRKIAANAVRGVLLFIGLILAMTTAGLDLTALSVLGGAVGVGVGLGLQKLASNYVSGFVVLAEQSLRIGDLVNVDGFEGRITDIYTRYTVLRALNGRECIIPNELLVTQKVENASLADPDISLSTVVQVAYGTDIESLQPKIAEAVRAVPRVVRPDDVSVLLTNFAADGLELTIMFWIADPERGQNSVRSNVNLAILRVLNANHIDIPFPQRVVHAAETQSETGHHLTHDHSTQQVVRPISTADSSVSNHPDMHVDHDGQGEE